MNHRSVQLKWTLIASLALVFALAACVRPVPGSEDQSNDATATPTAPDAVDPGATVPAVLPTLAPPSPTPQDAVPTPDPAQPTPIPPTVAPTDPGGGGAIQLPATHVVAQGDTLYSISQIYGVSEAEIMAANGMTNPNVLTVGQQLTIPAPGTSGGGSSPGGVHTVSPGENLFRIGLNYGCSVDQMSAYNNIAYPYTIYVGQQIQIPPDC